MTTLLVLCALAQAPAADAVTPAPAPAPVAAAPSAALMNLVALEGVRASTAELLTSNLVAHLRGTNHFSRVVTNAEIQSLLGLEQQQQLLNCDTSSCMAELAGAMGVDYVVRGTIGRLGQTWTVNISMLNTNSGLAERTVLRTVPGSDEAALLPVMKEVADQLVGKTAVSVAEAAPQPQPVKEDRGGGGMTGTVLKALGGAGLLGAGVALVVALLGALTAGGIWLLLGVNPDFTNGTGRGLGLTLGYGAGLGALALGLVLMLVGLSGGGALLVAGVVL